MTPPRSALRFPLEGAAPAAWRSQFRGALESGSANEPADDTARARYRAVFISDLHLGTPGCQAAALLDFLKAHPSQYLYLVGDIVDGWQLRRRWYWPQAHNDVVQKLLRAARKGCRVIYVPGNHDEFAREFIGHQFGGIEVLKRRCTAPLTAARCGSFTATISTA
jgi:predicted MPP superfamily phosphohydrolase